MRPALRTVLIAAFAAAVMAVLSAYGAWSYITSYRLQSGDGQLVRIPAGFGSSRIADLLHEIGVLDSPVIFKVLIRLRGVQNRLQWGEYALSTDMTADDFIDSLVEGRRHRRSFVLPEGLWTADLQQRLLDEEALIGPVPDLADIMVLPDTYDFEWGDTRATLITRMTRNFQNTTDMLWQQRGGGLAVTDVESAVILASIIEKETGRAGERDVISAVFHNRLSRSIRLQSDPTVIFALTSGGPLDRTLTRTDLRRDHPYNTYTRRGLPPGPICYPGKQALVAAMTPAASDYLYFVADAKGGHRFAKTLEDHNKNVRAYRAALNADSDTRDD